MRMDFQYRSISLSSLTWPDAGGFVSTIPANFLDRWLEASVPLALQGAFRPVTWQNSPSGILFTKLVGFCDVLVVLNMYSSPESRCLLVGACGRILGDCHITPGQDQQLVSRVSITSSHLKRQHKIQKVQNVSMILKRSLLEI